MKIAYLGRLLTVYFGAAVFPKYSKGHVSVLRTFMRNTAMSYELSCDGYSSFLCRDNPRMSVAMNICAMPHRLRRIPTE